MGLLESSETVFRAIHLDSCSIGDACHGDLTHYVSDVMGWNDVLCGNEKSLVRLIATADVRLDPPRKLSRIVSDDLGEFGEG